MTKKEALERLPLISMFEEILSRRAFFNDSKNWRDCAYSCHVSWLQPLIDNGSLVETSVNLAWPVNEIPKGATQHNYHFFAPTPSGMQWWYKESVKDIKDRNAALVSLLDEYGGAPAQIVGKGIGAFLRYEYYWGQAQKAIVGIQEGYFEFESFCAYPIFEKYVIVRLTEKGLRFFDAVPRLDLQLVCA